MAAWREVEASAPELAAAVRALLDAGRHKTIATLRRDGSPRISGIEAMFADGDLWFGGMWESRKALDLRRDPRFALHSASPDPPGWPGDAKVAGRVEEVFDRARFEAVYGAAEGEGSSGRSHLFRADLAEVVLTRLGEPADHLLIELWRPGEPVRRMRR
jgi:pyridoxamine 5'-phosphate oxidase-like protein